MSQIYFKFEFDEFELIMSQKKYFRPILKRI
jgi:hypothetical protein